MALVNLLTANVAFPFAAVFIDFNEAISSALHVTSVDFNVFMTFIIARAFEGLVSSRS